MYFLHSYAVIYTMISSWNFSWMSYYKILQLCM